MKKQLMITTSILLALAACKPEQERFVQPTASEVGSAAASDANLAASQSSAPVAAVSAASMASATAQAASASSAPATASAASQTSDIKLHKTKKIPIGGDAEFGNTVFYFPDSIKKEGKLYYVMTENRFKTPQPLPKNGKPFLYSLIKEAVDCERKFTDPVSVSHFSEKDELVDKEDFPYPDYNSWSALELEALANEHPDAAFINAVCQRKK